MFFFARCRSQAFCIFQRSLLPALRHGEVVNAAVADPYVNYDGLPGGNAYGNYPEEEEKGDQAEGASNRHYCGHC